jgi:hypothetical protein
MAGLLRMTFTVDRFEPPNRNRSAVPDIPWALVLLQKLDINFKILLYTDR